MALEWIHSVTTCRIAVLNLTASCIESRSSVTHVVNVVPSLTQLTFYMSHHVQFDVT